MVFLGIPILFPILGTRLAKFDIDCFLFSPSPTVGPTLLVRLSFFSVFAVAPARFSF